MQYDVGLVDPVTRKIAAGCEDKPAYLNMPGHFMASTNFSQAMRAAQIISSQPKVGRFVLFAICIQNYKNHLYHGMG